MQTKPSIVVWLVEDAESYATLFKSVIGQFNGIDCRRVFSSMDEILATLRMFEERPDIVLVDIEIAGTMTGLEGARPLKERLPLTPIVMHTVNDTAEAIFEALRAGSSGYISKKWRFEDIAASIRCAVDGALLFDPEVARKVLGYFKKQAKAPPDYDLTDRQFDVLRSLCEGLSQKEMADRLSITQRTIDNHLRAIYQKMHVHSGIEAVVKAFREGLVSA